MAENLDAERYLDAHARDLVGPALSFRVCYWGVQAHHLDNLSHSHPFFEVCYVRGGVGQYLEEGRIYPLKPGTIFCSRPGIVHQIKSARGLDLAYVAFEVNEDLSDRTSVQAYYRLCHASEVVVEAVDAAKSPSLLLWQSVLRSANALDWTSAVMLPPLAFALLTSFGTTFAPGSQATPSVEDSARTGGLVDDICAFIQGHLAYPLGLDEVARQFHLSPRHLSRIFRKTLGVSPVRYIRDQRIARAKHLLRYTPLSLEQVAAAVGYHSVYYFSHAFSESVGMPPGKYRKTD